MCVCVCVCVCVLSVPRLLPSKVVFKVDALSREWRTLFAFILSRVNYEMNFFLMVDLFFAKGFLPSKATGMPLFVKMAEKYKRCSDVPQFLIFGIYSAPDKTG